MARNIQDQKAFADAFGGLQSGGVEARPVEGRLLIDIQFEDGSYSFADAEAPPLDGLCQSLTEAGVYAVAITGLSAGAPPDLSAARGETAATALAEACPDVEVEAVPAGATDALPVTGEAPDATLIELRVIE